MANEMDTLNNLDGVAEEKAVDTSKKIKIGIIGTGWIAGSHATSYKNLEDVEIVACADLIPGKAEAFCKKYGFDNARCYESGHAMLEAEKDLDGVSICTYNCQHAPVAANTAPVLPQDMPPFSSGMSMRPPASCTSRPPAA